MSKVLAFYLPQYHPIPENDEWWGKGFTEWTNVGKAKPLYPGHYQPRIPADLGYYDLRVSEVRIQQAEMAKEYGVDGFCYWHYWFGEGKRLLETPLNEVLKTKEPDFPFCLGWANHSWKAKTWSKDGKDRVLIEQKYPGVKDYEEHFKSLLETFKDDRYIKDDEKPVFMVWEPENIPDIDVFFNCWNKLAIENGYKGVYFIGFTYNFEDIKTIKKMGFNDVIYDPIINVFKNSSPIKRFFQNVMRTLFSVPRLINYNLYARVNTEAFKKVDYIPCVLPNFDHTPRSGKRGFVLLSTPGKFRKHLDKIFSINSEKTVASEYIIIKSWNEWGEGNHLEPDLKYKHKYLEALKSVVDKYRV